jgi:hypothetical protein
VSDQTIAAIITAGTVLLLPVIGRVLDWLIPKGWHARWLERHSVRDESDDQDGGGDPGE